MDSDNSKALAGNVALAFLSGLLLGAGTAFLLTPQSGEETRKRFLRVARRMGEDFKDISEKATYTWDDVYIKGRDFMKEAGSILKEAVEAGHDAMQKEKEPSPKEHFPHP